VSRGRRPKVPTWVSLVHAEMRRVEDFASVRQLQARLKAPNEQLNCIHAALSHLRKHQVVDVVVEVDGRGWWFLLPSGSDTRSRSVEERAPEEKPRKQRKVTVKKVQK